MPLRSCSLPKRSARNKMNKNESRYFNTAARMDQAFLELLEKKDFSYITVKEICQKAGVNRSTFYLHYETLEDLLLESVEYMNEEFLSYMNRDSENFVARIKESPLENLYLITPEYLMPYLGYIYEHRKLFLAATQNARTLRLDESYDKMFQHVLSPILERYGVPEKDRPYILSFCIHGIMAVIADWLKQDCKDSTEHIASVIQRCIRQPQ